MSRFVRSSKFRHVFGAVAKKEDCYDDLKVTRTAWDSNYAAAGAQYFAVLYEAGGGGAFVVLPYSTTGKIDPKTPLVAGHKGAVLDVDFNPFNDGLVASGSEDCTAKIWGIPEGGLKESLTESLQTLNGHKRKVGSVKFSPTANNILATTSTDYAVKIWDIEKGKDVLSVDAQHTDIIQSSEWNRNGTLIATTCKDKKLRIIDPRSKTIVQEAEAHQGIKGSRVIYLGMDKLFSCGFSKTSEREFAIWDARNLSNKLTNQTIDSASGLLMPFYDEDTKVIFLGGKGDGNIRYYEYVDEAPYVYYLDEFKSATPQRGLCLLPKRAVNISENEIVRILKVSTKMVEPISFQVPRKSDMFQDDIFPDCFSGEPALTADEWLSGKNGEPRTRSLAPGFVQKKTVVDFNPEKQSAPKELSDKELKDEYEKLKKRVSYLEAEVIKKDARIKELQGH
jgi:coronin-1B/1C/6